MGGWLVPTYRPITYERTLRDPRPPVASPTLEHLHLGRRTVELEYSWNLGAGRQTALETVLHRLQGDLGKQIAREGEVMAVLRPFLAMRVLGVIPLGEMSAHDAMLCCAKLAEIRDPDLTLTELAASTLVRTAP
ncbi:MAG TPA: hypothetical protein VFB58_16840 [Chloroflexota bacterium]|nr:hypothetical protein [Chloroflexota bacterium]